MRKKDYELMAQSITRTIQNGYNIEFLIQDLAESFGMTNPKFDRQKFLQHCGIITTNEVSNLQKVPTGENTRG